MDDNKEILSRLEDLIFVNSVIATELIRITENTVGLLRGQEFLEASSCKPEHDLLNEKIMAIVKKYKSGDDSYSALEKHVIKHLE